MPPIPQTPSSLTAECRPDHWSIEAEVRRKIGLAASLDARQVTQQQLSVDTSAHRVPIA
jgi:hypothetical protein